MSEFHHDHEHTEQELAQKKALRPVIERDTKYWLSLEQFNQDPEFMKMAEMEFQNSPIREDGSKESGWARREFLKLMGASVAMATAGCIRRPVQKIVPYNKAPEDVTLGVANYYSSAVVDGSEAVGVLVKTREGRPLKIEGNPSHSLFKGATTARVNASILSLYDPERLQGPKHNLFNEKKTNKDTVNVKWEALDEAVVAQLKKGSVTVLTGNISSPATRAVIGDFAQAFSAKHVSWEPFAYDTIREANKATYGEDSVPFYRFDKAKLIVSIDADFLGTWLMPATFTKQFSSGRKDLDKMSRLVSFDSSFSLTGANADIRFRIKPSQQIEVVMALIHELIVTKGVSSYSSNSSVKATVSQFGEIVKRLGVDPALFREIANDLWENRGQSLVVAGGIVTQTEMAKELQVAVNFLNSILDNDGKTVEGASGNKGIQSSYSELAALIKDMAEGKVKTLIIHRTNPVHALPADAGFVEALKKVEMVVYSGDRVDEVGQHANFIAPDNHPLESWGDAEPVAGVYTIQQPTIRPMYDTRSFQLSLMTWGFIGKVGPKRLQTYESFYDYLRAFWKEEIKSKVSGSEGFEELWQKALQQGYVGAVKDSSGRSFKVDAFTAIKGTSPATGYELALYPTIGLGDGTQNANVSWLYELPDPITKAVWDNYAMVSLATADKLKLKQNDVVEVVVGANKVELPVLIQPGLHDEVVAVAVGFGRTLAGKVGNDIGKNAYQLGTFTKGKAVFSGLKVELKKTGKVNDIAITQGHHSMEGRQIVVEATLKDYQKKKDAIIHKHQIWSLWSGHQYNGHKWGMAVDLNSCTGCSACVVSCQSENNIPVVGKKYILQGREMHWIRIDRYYTGNPADAEAVFQPVMCQHCDNAPCETVCPVAATVHSDEGTNDMAYNRCVGTRYCANNCPYKVRRFNWFNYAKLIEKPMHMALNPDVTVRVRGVMEKCTFCVHRIKEAKNKARLEQRALKDGDVKTACQTACPTDAIMFGDVNDENSVVAKAFKKEPRAYALLEEWHAAPSVRYLAKIRNNGKEGQSEHGTHKQGEHS